MNFLKTVWPTPFKIKKGNFLSFVIQLVIFLIICAVVGWLVGKLSGIAVIGWIFGIIGSLMGVYSTVGIVLCFLVVFGVIK